MSSFNKWVGVEDVTQTDNVEVDAGMIPQSDLDIQTTTTALDEAEAEHIQLVDNCDDACDAVSELSAYQNIAEAAVENGQGLVPETAQAMSVAIESVITRLNLKNTGSGVIPGVEHFKTQRRLKATQIGFESLGETIKAGMQVVIDFIKKMWEYVVVFVTKIFDKAAGLEKKLKYVEQRVDKMDDGSFDDGKTKFKDRRVALSFGVIGKNFVPIKNHREIKLTFNPEQIYNHHRRLGALGDIIIDSGTNFIEGVKKQTENKEKSTDLHEYYITLGQVFEKSGCPTYVQRNNVGESGVSMWDLADVSGFFIYSAGPFNVAIKQERVTQWFGAPKLIIDEEVPILHKSDMKWHLSQAKEIIADTKKLQGLKSRAKSVSNEMTKMVKDFSSSNSTDLRRIKSITTIVTSMSTKIPKINLNAVEAAIRYVEHSMAHVLGVPVKDVSGERGQVEPGMSMVLA